MKKIQLMLILALVCALLCGCTDKQTEDEEVPELLPAAGVASDICIAFLGDMYLPVLHDAEVVAYVEELSISRNANVDEVFVVPGQDVKAGEKLISFDLDSEREQAEALEESIAYTKKVNKLDNEITEKEIEILKAEYEQLRAAGADAKTLALKELDIEQAELSYNQTVALQELSLAESQEKLDKLYETLSDDGIYAPFDGRIANVLTLEHGSRISAYNTVIYLADNSRVSISTEYVSDSTYAQANGGVYALIGGKRYEVERVPIDYNDYLSVVLAGGTVYCQFDILGLEEGQTEVEAGDYCALIFLNNYSADTLLIPSNAVLSDADSKYVYVVGENGVRVRRDIKVKSVSGAIYSVVTEGLEEGERIYVTDK